MNDVYARYSSTVEASNRAEQDVQRIQEQLDDLSEFSYIFASFDLIRFFFHLPFLSCSFDILSYHFFSFSRPLRCADERDIFLLFFFHNLPLHFFFGLREKFTLLTQLLHASSPPHSAQKHPLSTTPSLHQRTNAQIMVMVQ